MHRRWIRTARTLRSRLHRGRKMLQKALWQVAEERGVVRELTRERESA